MADIAATPITTLPEALIVSDSDAILIVQGGKAKRAKAQLMKGQKGDVGATGLKGDKGDKGDQGIQGVKGDTGATGVQGIKGDKGDVGPKGDVGLQGPKGDVGAQGPPGTKGDTGAAGAQGIQGFPGAKGDKGDKGDPYVASHEQLTERDKIDCHPILAITDLQGKLDLKLDKGALDDYARIVMNGNLVDPSNIVTGAFDKTVNFKNVIKDITLFNAVTLDVIERNFRLLFTYDGQSLGISQNWSPRYNEANHVISVYMSGGGFGDIYFDINYTITFDGQFYTLKFKSTITSAPLLDSMRIFIEGDKSQTFVQKKSWDNLTDGSGNLLGLDSNGNFFKKDSKILNLATPDGISFNPDDTYLQQTTGKSGIISGFDMAKINSISFPNVKYGKLNTGGDKIVFHRLGLRIEVIRNTANNNAVITFSSVVGPADNYQINTCDWYYMLRHNIVPMSGNAATSQIIGAKLISASTCVIGVTSGAILPPNIVLTTTGIGGNQGSIIYGQIINITYNKCYEISIIVGNIINANTAEFAWIKVDQLIPL